MVANPIERPRFSDVLVVEDNDAQRSTLHDLLQQEGFQPVSVANAQDAINRVREKDFGVAVLDFRLPDITGTELLRRIREINESVRVIIHTAYGSFDSAKDAVNQGAFAYVEKAGSPDELLRHVHRAVQAQYHEYTGGLEAAVAERTASLNESRERYRSLVELSPDGIALYDERGFLYVNGPGASILGIPNPENLKGRFLRDFVSGEQQSRVEEKIRAIVREKTARDIGQFVLRSGPAGERHVEIRGVHVIVAGNPAVQLLLRDVTERVRSEEERRTIEASLRETQKMEVAGRLAAEIAHDFNNLLTVILGGTELLRDRLGPTQINENSLKNLLEQIEGAGQRAAALTSRLLTFGRRQPVRLESVDMNSVIRGIEHLLQGVLGDRAQLEFLPTENLPAIRADVTQIEQVIMNLAINARDAMPRGGVFTLKTDVIQPSERFAATHPESSRGPMVRLRATDTGTGMSPETRERIFEPYFTTKPRGKGTGLGLPTVYGIVRQGGGWINVTSEVDRGTEFALHWPADSSNAVEASKKTAVSGSRTGHILLCEDDEVVRQITTQILRLHGYSVVTTGSAAEALAAVDAAPFDVLVSDISMPDVHGLELARQIRLRRPSLAIVLMSGCSVEEQGQLQATGESYPILQKPFKSDQLLEFVDSAVRAHRSVNR